MPIVCPAVLASTPDAFLTDLKRAQSLASRAQIDICDGEFADNQTVNLSQISWPEDLSVDLHLMVHEPAEQEHDIIALGPNLVIVHVEAKDGGGKNKVELLEELKQVGIKTGVALLAQSQPSDWVDLIKQVDHVLIFTGHLGHYGGDMDESQLTKIAQVKQINPQVEVGVDGGINADNAAKVVAAGADVLNVGGYIQQAADPQSAYATIEQIVNS